MRSIRSYQREIRELKQLLTEAEWYQPSCNASPSCPFCAAQQHWNHADDCPYPSDLRAPMAKRDNGEWELA